MTDDTHHFPSLALGSLPPSIVSSERDLESVLLQDFLKLQSSLNKLTLQVEWVSLQSKKCSFMASLIVNVYQTYIQYIYVSTYIVLFNIDGTFYIYTGGTFSEKKLLFSDV